MVDWMKDYTDKEMKLYNKYEDIKNKASSIVVDYIRKNNTMKSTIIHLLKNPKNTHVNPIIRDEKFIANWISALNKAKSKKESDKVLEDIGISVSSITLKFTPVRISSNKILNTMISNIVCDNKIIKMSGTMSLLERDYATYSSLVVNEEYIFKKNVFYPEELTLEDKTHLSMSMRSLPMTVGIHLKYEDYNVSPLISQHLVRCVQMIIDEIREI